MTSGPAVVAVSAKRRTQDAWGAARGPDGGLIAAWVLDGATALGAQDRRSADEQVARFAWTLSAALRAILTDADADANAGPASGEPLHRIVEAARAQAQRSIEIGWPGAEIPTATLSLVRRTGQGLECFVLGDSPLWIEDGDRLREVVDPQFAGGDARVLRRWHELRAQGSTAEAAYAELLEAQVRNRRTRSTEDGLWILGGSAQAAQHAHVELIPGAEPRRVCLLTDGLERVVDPFRITDRRGLFEALQTGSAAPLAQRLRGLEREDPRRVRAPRMTVHDDITGMAITL